MTNRRRANNHKAMIVSQTWKKRLFKLALLLVGACQFVGCGGGIDGRESTPTADGVQLALTAIDYADGASYSANTVLIYNPHGATFEEWTADADVNYLYDAHGTLVRNDIEYRDSTVTDSVTYLYDDDGNLVSKRYERNDGEGHGQLYLTISYAYDNGQIVTETHVAPYMVDSNGDILPQDNILTTISYRYAYRDATQSELIVFEKRSLSTEGEIHVYYSYDAAKAKIVNVEYDWDNDFNIDTFMEITYDTAGNREEAKIYDHDSFGNDILKLSILYDWEPASANTGASLSATSGLVLGLSGGPYY